MNLVSGVEWASGIRIRTCSVSSTKYRSGRGNGLSTLPLLNLKTGGAYHQYQPLTKKGNHEVGGGFNDDPLWLIEGRIAESVFIAGLFVYTGPDFIELCKRRGLDEEAATAQAYVDRMQTATLEHGFDGEWFLRAYDHYGDKIGSKDCEEGQISLNLKVSVSWQELVLKKV